jgi:hypothetical protein
VAREEAIALVLVPLLLLPLLLLLLPLAEGWPPVQRVRRPTARGPEEDAAARKNLLESRLMSTATGAAR